MTQGGQKSRNQVVHGARSKYYIYQKESSFPYTLLFLSILDSFVQKNEKMNSTRLPDLSKVSFPSGQMGGWNEVKYKNISLNLSSKN